MAADEQKPPQGTRQSAPQPAAASPGSPTAPQQPPVGGAALASTAPVPQAAFAAPTPVVAGAPQAGAPRPPDVPSSPLDHIPGDENASIVGLVEVAGKNYAASLIWNTAVDAKYLVKEAKDGAERLGGNGFCVYTPAAGEPIYGLTEEKLGHKPGQVSLAAQFAGNVEPSYVGTFITDDGKFWLIAIVDDGTIVFDKAFISVEDAKREFLEMARLSYWKTVVCPAQWGADIVRGDQKTLADIIGAKQTGPRIRALKLLEPKVVITWVVIIIVAILLLHFGHVLFTKWTKSAPAPVVRSTAAPQKAAPPVQRPWAGHMQGDAVFQACTDQILKNGLVIVPGWNGPSTISCSESGVLISLSKGVGTTNWVMPTVPKTIDGLKVSVDMSKGSSIEISWPLPPLDTYKNEGRGDDLGAAKTYLTDNFEEIGQTITLTGTADRLSYTFTTPNDIRSFRGLLLGRFSAYVVNKISVSVPEMTWVISGSIYADNSSYAQETDAPKPASAPLPTKGGK